MNSFRLFNLLIISILTIIFANCNGTNTLVSESETSPQSTQIEKQSIFEKMKELDHLPVADRIAVYKQLKRDSLNTFTFEDENELNRYGYHLLSLDKTQEAIAIFDLLISEFPNSSNAYDSLGEAYLKAGNEALSLKNYEKSVELNPENYHAVDQITRIKGLELLVTDWGKEIFHFPIHFAPKIPYLGVEEVVFPKNWIKPDSADFWSYVFVWAIENQSEVKAIELNLNLTRYFNGLNDHVPEDQMTPTVADIKRNTNPNDSATFIGSLRLFDHFATMEEIRLNVRIYSEYCEENEKLMLLFRFSPQDFDHPVWDLLRTVKLRSSVCTK